MRHTVNIDGLRSFLALQWQNCCKKAGLPIPSIEHGVDLQDGTFALDYVSKWGLEDEMTKGHTKKVVKVALRLLTCLSNPSRCQNMASCSKSLQMPLRAKLNYTGRKA